ncbi:VanW family protein [Clostridium sp.]|uniref:VanW family protein n=1 Tax=Clostridium sp. TaxID=1506 RepID=UPI003F2A6685
MKDEEIKEDRDGIVKDESTLENNSKEKKVQENKDSKATESAKIESRVEKNSSKKKFKYWKHTMIASIIAAIIIGAGIFIGVKANNTVNGYSDKVYPGAYVFEQEVSSFTRDELRGLLESMVSDIGDKQVEVKINDRSFPIAYRDFEANISYEEFENEILNYGKDLGLFEKLDLIKNPEKRTYEFKINYNEDKLKEIVANIGNEVRVNPNNAGIDVTGASVSVFEGSNGAQLNEEEVVNKIKETLSNSKSEDIVAINTELVTVEPSIKTDSLRTVNSKISSYSTTYPGGPSGTNLEIAARSIDNTLIMPGEIFSTEQAIGPTTIENGYVEANIYINGKVEKGVGGGVCQVASTLYNTQLRAGILPVERLNHMMPVSYVPLGLDATLADNAIDLKFKNEFDFPIVINSYAGGGNLVIEFWSNESALGGVRYEPKSYPTSSLSADTYLYGYKGSELVYEHYIDSSKYDPLP